VTLGAPGAPVHIGNLHNPQILLAIFGFLLIGYLMLKNIRGSMLIGILVIAAISFIFKFTPMPARWIDTPPDITPIFMQLDIRGALNIGFFAVILTIFVMDFVDTLGTLLGLSMKAGFLDKNGNLPEIEKPMMCDAFTTTVAALLGTTTAGAYIESAAGVEAGGKSGLTAVFTALFFLLGLFFSPLFGAIPPAAYGPPVIIVGMLMLSPIKKINFDDLSEVIPVFTIIVLMSFTYNLGIGMTGGFVVYPLMKSLAGKYRDIKPGLWVLASFSLLFFIFYPY
jgi:AGZA family xanthine/uracil permease-like MFS transporter